MNDEPTTPRRRELAMLLPLKTEQVRDLDDDDLAYETDRRLALMPPRLANFARAIFAGESRKDAAERLGYSAPPSPGNVDLRLALALLREQARRAAHFTAEQAITRFRDISDRAYEKGEWSDATGALREASKIANLYPEAAAPGAAGAAPVVVQVALALPPRETPPSFLAAGSTLALAPSCAALEPLPADGAESSGALPGPRSEPWASRVELEPVGAPCAVAVEHVRPAGSPDAAHPSHAVEVPADALDPLS